LQLLFAFIILSTITLIAVLLILVSKNSRSGKIREISNQYEWDYQEYLDFNNEIKNANFGLLNYSQNVIFRHELKAPHFSFFDCRAIEPSGIHNSSVILSYLKLEPQFLNLHASFSPIQNTMQSPEDNNQARLRHMQKLSIVSTHYAFEEYQLHSNNPHLLEIFIQQHIKESGRENNLSTWLLAHPHLHIEISNGILLAYQPNCLLDEASIAPAINAVIDVSKCLNKPL
jgi:hypothetical protein|tara:strand:+ start:11198 stop:11884 length:687 start_codon:yes stop_codon:yes gene_type:complete